MLELTGRYDEEERLLTFIKGLMRRYKWSDGESFIYKTYRDDLLNAETLLKVRQGQLTKAGQLVDQLIAKIANDDERNEYEALRAIAEYYKHGEIMPSHSPLLTRWSRSPAIQAASGDADCCAQRYSES